MEPGNIFGLWAIVGSTVAFVVALGVLVLVAVRAKRRENNLYRQLDDEIPKLAERVNQLHEKKHGKRNTKLDLIINESFSARPTQAKLR
jgi:predicted PurR-regulated permease PerM